ncbi:hypothetical protein COEREDRAFT_71423 [Coemansia reversa NRRL 1564]|uniref:RRM domain-containing protein n=1 Tax=Coemansia reversa (strain ATCC 12441 / NRRL 1564) TaxID=763665 RepID=A0A2G5BF59_COERN|nr:hypothetical protein COEREDRAFT_71423 [Coemansia reversa NRRL 1564]|eukprot:PIA17622.1 hypothetical protein COEREDRAFT_71423 [Coemansia reversa NRRL 1564]
MGNKKTKRGSSNNGLEEIGGYKVLPVRFGDDSDGATHYLYFRQHSTTKEDMLRPTDRTIFMANLPADATERDIRRLFQGVARVARVIFNGAVGQDPVVRSQLLVSGSTAHIVLLEVEELDSVLSMKAGTIRQWPARDAEDVTDPREYRGLARYIYEHRAARPPADMLRSEVDGFMSKFEEARYERERMVAQQHNTADADGFVTVVRRGRHTKNSDGTGSVVAASVAEARAAGEKKTEVVFGNMYRFQMRERKTDQLAELRQKFEEDKERIARMRQARKFRPF